MTTLMRNGRDRRSENPGWVTRGKSAWFCLGPISGSHQGQRPNGRISKAEYMTAPERFADSQIPLAPWAPSIHDPSATWLDFARHVMERASLFRLDAGELDHLGQL